MKNCPYKIIIKDFDWRIKLCKAQQCFPVFCLEHAEDCPVYKEYNIPKSGLHPNADKVMDENVR